MAYIVLRKLERGELLPVATFDELDEAMRLVEGLYEYWPADYLVRNSESGTDMPIAHTGGQKHEGFRDWDLLRAARRWQN